MRASGSPARRSPSSGTAPAGRTGGAGTCAARARRSSRWNSYAARPQAAAARGGADSRPRCWSASGAGARREPLEHGGNSGAALERVVLGDGTSLIAKRVGPGADWLGRVTNDRGRTALLWQAGAFERMPPRSTTASSRWSRTATAGGWSCATSRPRSSARTGGSRGPRAGASSTPRRRCTRRSPARCPTAPPSLDDRLGMSSLRVAEAERAGPDLLPKQLDAAWDAFADSVPEDVAERGDARGARPVAARRGAASARAR